MRECESERESNGWKYGMVLEGSRRWRAEERSLGQRKGVCFIQRT